jgi:chemotaxis protein CheX
MNAAAHPTAEAGGSPESWRPLLQVASQEVFEMMVGCRLQTRTRSAATPFEFTAMVGFAGQMCGRFTMRSSKQSAAAMASKMLGVSLNHDDAQIWDAIGEIANMIAGNFKNKIVGLENRCMLSLPTVITGSDYKYRAMKNSYLLEAELWFEEAPLTVTVEIHGLT